MKKLIILTMTMMLAILILFPAQVDSVKGRVHVICKNSEPMIFKERHFSNGRAIYYIACENDIRKEE